MDEQKKEIVLGKKEIYEYLSHFSPTMQKQELEYLIKQSPEMQIVLYFKRIGLGEKDFSFFVEFIMRIMNLDEDTAKIYLDDIVDLYIKENYTLTDFENYELNTFGNIALKEKKDIDDELKQYGRRVKEKYGDVPGEYAKKMIEQIDLIQDEIARRDDYW